MIAAVQPAWWVLPAAATAGAVTALMLRECRARRRSRGRRLDRFRS